MRMGDSMWSLLLGRGKENHVEGSKVQLGEDPGSMLDLGICESEVEDMG